jgi:hypothetical protein
VSLRSQRVSLRSNLRVDPGEAAQMCQIRCRTRDGIPWRASERRLAVDDAVQHRGRRLAPWGRPLSGESEPTQPELRPPKFSRVPELAR